MKRIRAVFFLLSHKLETHYFFQVSLKNWLWVVLVVPPALAFLGGLSWAVAVPLSVAGALLLAGTVWARRNHYVVFENALESVVHDAFERAPIQVDEQVRCRAFGLFAVEGKKRYVLDADALFSFVRTREHILVAYVGRTRFLLLAASPKHAVGCWYVFMTPERLQAVRRGTLFYGFARRAALSIHYRSEENAGRSLEVYLAMEDEETLRRVLEDLARDAPEGVCEAP